MKTKALLIAGLLAALALLVAGCGSNEGNGGTAPPAGQSGQRPQFDQQAFAKFQQCLENHGVTLPSGRPQGGQPGQRPTFDAKTQQAFDACRQYLPSQPQGGFDGQGPNAPSAQS